MGRSTKSVLTISVFMLLASIPPLQAQWVEEDVAVCTANGNQQELQIISDDAGGAIITWQDYRGADNDIYAQRIDGDGYVQWTSDGVAICTAANSQDNPQIASDGASGAIITWQDHRSGSGTYLYAQRIDADSVVQWPVDGAAVCTAAGSRSQQQIIPDGYGGAIITWIDVRTTFSVYAQRIDAGGEAQWTENGVAVCTTAGMKTIPQIASDSASGAIITWQDYYNGNWDIYAQRLAADSTAQWTLGGLAICTATGNQYDPDIIPDGAGGAIITWEDGRGGSGDIYAQRIDAGGTAQWTADGVAICTATGQQGNPHLMPDGAGGAIIVWEDTRGDSDDIYAQRISGDGTAQWTADGVAVCTQPEMQSDPEITPDGDGGAIIAWYDTRSGEYGDIYAQRIGADGMAQWTAGGVAICTAPDDQVSQRLVFDSCGGAILAWADYRSGDNNDIYAQLVDFAGHLGYYYPAPHFSSILDVPKDQGGKLSLRWQRSFIDTLPNSEITHYSLWRLLPETGMGGPGRENLSPIEELGITLCFNGTALRLLPLASGYAWEWIGNVPARHVETYALTVESLYDSIGTDPGWQYFIATAHTEDPVFYYDSPMDSGYSVDNLAPGMPLGFAGNQSLAPVGLRLSWAPNPEPDLSHYAVYRGDDEGFIPGESNLLATTTDTVHLDGEWTPSAYLFYKLAAVDVHGNRGPDTLLRPEDINLGTLLQSFSASFMKSWIELSWTLSEAGTGMQFVILREYGADGAFVELSDPDIAREGLSFIFRDESCEPGGVYRYRVEVLDEEGRRVLFETDKISTPAIPLTLYQNHPNPFNPTTTIRFYLPERGFTTLDVYDASGSRIARLISGERGKGHHIVEWNGLDIKGKRVSSGIYFYRLRAGKESISRKMILLK